MLNQYSHYAVQRINYVDSNFTGEYIEWVTRAFMATSTCQIDNGSELQVTLTVVTGLNQASPNDKHSIYMLHYTNDFYYIKCFQVNQITSVYTLYG
mgnify:CR=1 FL=1